MDMIQESSINPPELIHFEVTTRCPIRCPQCYVKFDNDRDMDRELLLSYIREASSLKVRAVAFSGGEPLSYPHLVDAVALASSLGIYSLISTSGVGLDEVMISQLRQAGIGSLYLSLNGSCEEINQLSRDGFHYIINAARLLKAEGLPFHLNWVARSDNSADFPAFVDLAQQLGAASICILLYKPDSQHEISSSPSLEEHMQLARYIQQHNHSQLPIFIERCYSLLRLILLNHTQYFGIEVGCSAGRNVMAVHVSGELIPCRHIEHPEKFQSIQDYWNNSRMLKKIRKLEEWIGEPCCSCEHRQYCRACRGVCEKLYGDFCSGDERCLIHQERLIMEAK